MRTTTQTAERVGSTGVVERIQLIPGPKGRLYTWLAQPPGARATVIICSSICADFTANYHRERLLGIALAARGLGVVRFHYSGEGNSDGEGADMTFESISADTAAVVEHVGATLRPERMAFHGTRLGGLVAGSFARSAPAPLSLWEPVAEPMRFFAEAFRFKRMNKINEEAGVRVGTWREELAENGVLDLLGYDAHPPLIESLERVSLASVLGDDPPRMFVAGFKDRPPKEGSAKEGSAKQNGASVDTASFALAETWWFHNEQVHEASGLIDATAAWLQDATGDGQP